MNTTDEQELTRWLDGMMTATESQAFEVRLQADPVMNAEAQAMKQLCGQVHEHFPRMADVPHPDFFNSQIQERIRELDLADLRKQETARPWLHWLRQPWLSVAGATAVLLLVGVAVFQKDIASESATTVNNMYAPDSQIQARAYHSAEADATVVVLEGVEEIPADKDVVSYKADELDHAQRLVRSATRASSTATGLIAMNDASLAGTMLE